LFVPRGGGLGSTPETVDSEGMPACRHSIDTARLAILTGLIAVAGAVLPAATPAKQIDGALPPGQAKKLVGDGPIQETGKGVAHGLAPAAEVLAPAPPPSAKPDKVKPDKVKPDKVKPVKVRPAKPPEADAQKRSLRSVAAPSESPAASPAPTSTALPAAASPAPPTPTAPATPATPTRPAPATDRGSRRDSAGRARRARTRRLGTPSTGPFGTRRLDRGTIAGPGTTDAPSADDRRSTASGARPDRRTTNESSPVVRTVRDIIEIVPGWVKLAIAALAALSLLLGGGYAVTALRARSLARQRSELLGEVGLLQRALLPAIPDELGALRASVAYRPADGPAAGGDFYDVLPLPGDRVGFVLGDVSGHGRESLERTAFMRYTLRAYLEAGLEPRVALQVAGRVIGDNLGGDFATVLLAVHDAGDGSLTYACAGHPGPIVVHSRPFEPVTAGSSPPIGIGERTGLRQTTVPLPPGALACLYTDGLIEARTAEGLLGRERLERLVADLDRGATATDLLERVSAEAEIVPDDMATCLLAPTASVTSGGFRSEQLELSADELAGPLPARFLAECGVPADVSSEALDEAARTSKRFGGVVIDVVFGSRHSVEILPRNVESLDGAALSAAAGRHLGAAG
jgi:Stage II sporulation protein E (SpoIIE)